MVDSKAPDFSDNLEEKNNSQEESSVSEHPEDKEASVQEEIQQLKDQLLRALAETENVRKRAMREREEALQYAATNFARDLLAVTDNLRRALDSLPAEMESNLSDEFKAVIDGVKLTEKALLAAFEKHGIQKITPTGEDFNHTYHQAMFEVPTNDKPEGTVVEVLQPGYLMHGRLLRPAMVGVAKSISSQNTSPSQPLEGM